MKNLEYLQLEYYDGKLKDYIQTAIDKYYPVNTVIFMSNNVHPSYIYGGSWKLLNNGCYPCSRTTDGETAGNTYNTDGTKVDFGALPTHSHTYNGLYIRKVSYPSFFFRVTAYTSTASNAWTTLTGGGLDGTEVDKTWYSTENRQHLHWKFEPVYEVVNIWVRVEAGSSDATAVTGFSKP